MLIPMTKKLSRSVAWGLYFIPLASCGYVLHENCPPFERWFLFKQLLIWTGATLPIFVLLFELCRRGHASLGHPVPFRRRFDDEGDLVETAESYTELEAVDPKIEGGESEIQDARLRVHPSSRRKHAGQLINQMKAKQIVNNARHKQDDNMAQNVAAGAKKRIKGRRPEENPKTANDQFSNEDKTQHSKSAETLSKTQSLSPISSEYYRTTQPSSILRDSAVPRSAISVSSLAIQLAKPLMQVNPFISTAAAMNRTMGTTLRTPEQHSSPQRQRAGPAVPATARTVRPRQSRGHLLATTKPTTTALRTRMGTARTARARTTNRASTNTSAQPNARDNRHQHDKVHTPRR